MKRRISICILLSSILASSGITETRDGKKNLPRSPLLGVPTTQTKSHTAGNLKLAITNWGFFGNGGDCIDFDWSCEFPANSNQDYLFQGSIWIGGIVDGDTLLSVGAEGWQNEHEMFPGDGSTNYDSIIERSTDPAKPFYVDPADSLFDPYWAVYGPPVSHQDFIGVFADTNLTYTDSPNHKPMNIEVTQQSYQWNYEYAQDFVILNYWVENIGTLPITEMYVGIYIDADCGPVTCVAGPSNAKAQDDVTGFRRWRNLADTLWDSLSVIYFGCEFDFLGNMIPLSCDSIVDVTGKPKNQAPAEYINTAWLADANGWNESNAGGPSANPSVTGTRIVFPPPEKISFNWWISDENEALDFGPYDPSNPNDPPGTPDGDQAKYTMMSLGKFDPDEICAGLVYPPGVDSINDTRYFLSFGPFDLAPAEVETLILGYVGGERFHPAPPDFCTDYDFEDLSLNASWVYRVYDNPGVDTEDKDGFKDGFKGDFVVNASLDTLFLTGDGIPDFEGPPAPPTPILQVIPGDQKVTLLWQKHSENYENKFIPGNLRNDYFEGYRVYTSTTGVLGEFTLLKEFDRTDAGDTMDSGLPVGYNVGLPPDTVIGGDTFYVFYHEPVLNYFSRFYSVTAYDKGFPPGVGTTLGSLESSPLGNFKQVTPSPDADNFAGLKNKKKVMAVPNPYISASTTEGGRYEKMGWEDPLHAGWEERSRRIDFVNLPPRCSVRIFTLGGDLVRELDHDSNASISAGGASSAISWNLITKDIRTAVSGIYLFSVEDHDTGEVQVGKFIIIK